MIRACLILLSLCALCHAAQPNVLVVLLDDVGYGDLGCHGNPVIKTPHIDRLHADSARFTDFHSAPYCTPTRGQLMTGCDALRNGATHVCGGRSFIRADVPTMAEIFSSGGYCTGMFGKWHLGDNAPHRPQDRGFQEARYHLGWGLGSAPEMANSYFDGQHRHNGVVKPFTGFCTDFWFDSAMTWMKQCQSQGEPFLCYLPLNAAHGPFIAPEKSTAPYRDHPALAGFYGLIANIDDNMGRLDAMLRENGLRENTIVILTTDNGTAAGQSVFNAGMRGIKGDVHDGGHRVPCFVRWPGGGLRAAADIDTPAQMQDVLPTLIELCSVKSTAKLDGTSLAPLLRSAGTVADRMFVVQLHAQQWNSCVVWNQWRLVRGAKLYDIRADPAQSRDLAAGHRDVVVKMRAHYEQWWSIASPRLADCQPIHIGSAKENPVLLTSTDWQDVDDAFCGDASSVRRVFSAFRGAPWNVEVMQSGDYEITLRRWPAELDTAIAAGIKEPAGRAMPITTAHIVAAGQQQEQAVGAQMKAVRFQFHLPAGRTQIHGWFADADGRDACGAFYAEVRMKGQSN